MIYLYLFGTCFHFIYVFMIIGKYIHLNGVLMQHFLNIPKLHFGILQVGKIVGK